MNNRLRRLAVLAVLGVATIWAPTPVRLDVVATAAPKLEDLRSVDELKTLFTEDTGNVRLVLMVSPT
jgi:hypothetical protein